MSNHVDTEFDGRIAIIIDKDHPHCGSVCKCCGADKTTLGWGMKFRDTKTNEEFYVFDGSSVKWDL